MNTKKPGGKAAALAGLLLMLLLRPMAAVAAGRAGFPASHRSPALRGSRPFGRHDGRHRLTLDLVLPLRNRPALDDLLRRLYDPQDPLFGHYLTPAQVAAQFGPAQADVDAVRAFARAHGLAVQGIADNRTVVQVGGPARAVEDAFAVQLNDYQDEEGRAFFGADREPTVTPDVAGRLLGVLGLSNVGRPHAFSRRAPVPAATAGTGLLNYYTGIGSLAPVDVQNIYGMAGVPDTGTGQVAGLFEVGTYTASDIPAYFAQYHLPAIPVNPVSVDNYDIRSAPGSASGEVTLDIDMIAALAPGVSQIRVYEGTDQNTVSFPQLLHDAFTDMANDPQGRPSVISVSYGFSELYAAPSDFQTVDQATAILAAQGQSVCVASGDAGAYTYEDKGYGPNAGFPATDPYVTCVGGTDLSDTSDAHGNAVYVGETSWFDPSDTGRGTIGTGGGGGISGYWALPAWQAGAFSTSVNPQGSTAYRNVPDVSLYGDYDDGGYSIFYTPPGGSGGWYISNGTSAAAPLWAAFLADVDQARAAKGQAAIGCANPPIYRAAEGPDYAADFHDTADGSGNGFYNAVAGYDNATGWGSFNGGNLLNDLAPSSAAGTAVSVAGAAGTPGQTILLSGTLTAGGAALANRTLTFTANGAGAGAATTNASGVATVPYTVPAALAAGRYVLGAAFAGDDADSAGSGTGTLTVSQVSTTLAVANVGGPAGQVVALSATLTAGGSPLANATVSFTVNGAAAGTATTDASGGATVPYTVPAALAPGSYPITAAFAGDNADSPGSGTGTLAVTPAKVDTAVVASSVSGVYGQTVTLTGALTNAATHAAIAGGTLAFSIDGTGAGTATTGAKGAAALTYTVPTGLTVGSHVLAVAFAGDNADNPASGTGTLKVSTASVAVSVVSISGVYGQTVTLSATLTNATSHGALADEALTFSVDGAAVGTAATNVKGLASVPFTLPVSLAVGSHTLAASFGGDAYDNPGSGAGTLKVSKVAPSLSVPSVSGTAGQAVTLSGTLTNPATHAALAGETLTFTVNGTAAGTATTDASGAAPLPYTIPATLVAGRYVLTVAFAGDSLNSAVSRTGTLTVNKRNTALAVPGVTGTVGQTILLSGTLTAGGSPLANATVSITVDTAAVGTATTNASGVAALSYTVPATLAAGRHTIKAAFAGDGNDNASTGTGTLTRK